jgi:predicted nuclease with RNAse H fold
MQSTLGKTATPTTVVGIDVGGARKGFHAVALRDGRLHAQTTHTDPVALAGWCVTQAASIVAVDAPCRWRPVDRPRSAEQSLRAAGIHCFATPTEAGARRTAFHAWMLAGAALYRALEPHFPLYDRTAASALRCCVETFPHAIACALAGRVLRAGDKRRDRAQLLTRAGLDTRTLTTIDALDAALCALAAQHLAKGTHRAHGECLDGFIIVPRDALPRS